MRQEVYSEKQPVLFDCGTGKVFVRVNETEVLVENYGIEGNDNSTPMLMYRYDQEEVTVNDFSESNVLKALKSKLVERIKEYDVSDNVNGFYLGGKKRWLDKDLRAQLADRLVTEKAAGRTTTKVNFGGEWVEMPIETMEALLQQLNLYAIDCYDNTAAHKVEAESIDSIQGYFDYDITKGYPSMLTFTI
jgi:hypothetical protein